MRRPNSESESAVFTFTSALAVAVDAKLDLVARLDLAELAREAARDERAAMSRILEVGGVARRLTPLIAAMRLPSSMPAFSAGLPRVTDVNSRPSVSRGVPVHGGADAERGAMAPRRIVDAIDGGERSRAAPSGARPAAAAPAGARRRGAAASSERGDVCSGILMGVLGSMR